MTLPAAPPRYSSWGALTAPLKRGSAGWGVYGLQRALGIKPADGVLGAKTEKFLREWQHNRNLTADGICGPKTYEYILRAAGRKADRIHGLPDGVGYGFAHAEGAGVFAATNWSIPGAVDCGPGQYRIVGPPFKMDDLRAAFRPFESINRACDDLAERWEEYLERNKALDERPFSALEVAVLAHNWPAGAEQIVRSYRGYLEWWRSIPAPDSLITWAEKPNGQPYTRAEWCKHYSESILQFVARA